MASSGEKYQAPGIHPPTLQDLQALNKELNFKCTEEEMTQMAEMLGSVTESYQRVYKAVDPSLPLVKYPRTPGYRPCPEENLCNAWAWKCDIQGAPSGKLARKTVAIKDNVAVAGVPMRNGSKIMENYVPDFDATVVSRILDAGGRILGKSSVEDMCFSGSSITNSDGPVRNAHDENCIAGGSSSGSAVLVAKKVVDMAVGGDQGGSIRIPSSFNGIVGLKPTWGLVPFTGAAPIEPTVDHLGPMASTVTDCALFLEVIAGYDDGRDPRQHPSVPVPEYSKLVDQDVKGKKVGLLVEGFQKCTQEVQDVVQAAAKKLSTNCQCLLTDVSIPMHKDGPDIWTASAGFGLFKCMLENNGTILTKGFQSPSMHETNFRGLRTHPHDVPPLLKTFALYGKYIDQLYGSKFYTKAQNLVHELGKRYDAALKEYDVLVLPTLPHVASKIPPADCSFVDFYHNCLSMTANTMPFNSTGHPAITINAGFSKPDPATGTGRLPIGMMIVGKKFDEVTILQIARAFEKCGIVS